MREYCIAVTKVSSVCQEHNISSIFRRIETQMSNICKKNCLSKAVALGCLVCFL